MPHNQPGRASAAPAKYEQARVLGGGSSINGQLANRGGPIDYDEWEERGAAGWNWASVLPYFRKLERDIDFDGPAARPDGPMPIRRIFPTAMGRAREGHGGGTSQALGFRYIADQNGQFEDGYHPLRDHQSLRSARADRHRLPDAGDAGAAQPAISTDTHVDEPHCSTATPARA